MRSPRRTTRILGTLVVLAALSACAVDGPSTATQRQATSGAEPSAGEPTVVSSVQNDESRALRTMVVYPNQSTAGAATTTGGDATAAPTKNDGTNKPRKLLRKKIIPHVLGNGVDPAAQTLLVGPLRNARQKGTVTGSAAGPVSSSAPTLSAGFDSIGKGYSTFTVNSAPPDTNSAVGPSHVMTIVNSGLTIQTKSGAILYGPSATNSIFAGFGGACQTSNDGDGVVRYDRFAERWIITQFANVSSASGPYYECVAVSQTNDPTGAYYRYSFQFANFPDYPKFAVWPDAYYVTYNMFSAAGSWLYATVCAMDRVSMLAGLPATQQCYNTSSSYGGLLAGDADSATPPPAGAPNPIIALGVSNNDLAVWKFKPNFTTPANTTFTGPTSLTISTYSMACGGGNCITQLDSTNTLDGLGDRLMNRYAYWNFGDHQSLVVSHSVQVGSTVGVRWYEIRLDASNNASVYQQGTFIPTTTSHRWMPSIAMDKVGNIALGYSISGSTSNPNIAITGRLAGDPLGTMTQGETVLLQTTGAQTGSLRRWGDYASINTDPADDCTFWFSTEYLKTSGSFNWSTRVTSFSLPGCLAPPTDAFTITPSPSSGSTTPGGSVQTTLNTATTLGSGQTISLSASGLPTGASATFGSTSIATGSSTTMTVATTSATPAGTYSVAITGTGPLTSTTTNYTLTVSSFGVTLSPTSGAVTQGVGSVASTVSLSRVGNAQSLALSAINVPSGVTATFGSTTVNSGASTTLTLSATSGAAVGSYPITVRAVGTTETKSATFTFTVKAPVVNSLVNPGFESGTLVGWTASGRSNSVVTVARTGTYGARSGSTAPTNGISQIVQTATAPAGSTRLVFWYFNVCPANSTSRDYATATLRDNVAAKTTTVLGKTCTPTGTWRQITVVVKAGRSYTLTLINRDDNRVGQAGYTVWDDVAFSN